MNSERRNLIAVLQANQGDTRTQSAIAAEFILTNLPQEDRDRLRPVFDAASILRRFDGNLIGQLLDVSANEATEWVRVLASKLPFVESQRIRENEVLSIHESARLGWRQRMAVETQDRFRLLSARAASCFVDDHSSIGRIEWIYHLLSADPNDGAINLEQLESEWSSQGHPENRYALVAALKELEDTQVLEGRARLWTLLTIAGVSKYRGEAARLGNVAVETLGLARLLGDIEAEGSAQCLMGDVWAAQGKLSQAETAYEAYLSISKELAKSAPRNIWRRGVAAYQRKGSVLKALGKLNEAFDAFKEQLAIVQRLVELEPGNAGWQLDLSSAYINIGVVLKAHGKLSEAHDAYVESLAIRRRLVDLDPGNTEWQRGLAVGYTFIGSTLEEQGKLSEAHAGYSESLAIRRRLVELDPGNAEWQGDLARAYSALASVLKAEGKLSEAHDAYTESLAIRRRLVELDPGNTEWRRGLATIYYNVARVLRELGKLDEAKAANEADLAIMLSLSAQDPNNVDWQADLAATYRAAGKLLEAQGKLSEAQNAYEAADAISLPLGRPLTE
jgi:tetratricopeptide (TPR) repeat protein